MEEFKSIENNISGKYLVICDIDMSGKRWTPIEAFSGEINGDGHTLSNISATANAFSSEILQGLIGINSGVIKNLNLKDCSFKISPNYQNKDITIWCGAIAAINKGEVLNCTIDNTVVEANSSNIAELFVSQYAISPHLQIFNNSDSAHATEWKRWITQEYNADSATWGDPIKLSVFAGGITGWNSKTISDCQFNGAVYGNLYNMKVVDGYEQMCYAGGISGYNAITGSVTNITVDASVKAFAFLANDADGRGWVGDIWPTAYVYSGGIVGYSQNNSITCVSNNSLGEAYVRHYAPKYVLGSGASYSSSTKSHADNITSSWNKSYNALSNNNI